MDREARLWCRLRDSVGSAARLWLIVVLLLACLSAVPAGAAPTPDPPVRTVRLSPGEGSPGLDPAAGHVFFGNPTTGRIEMRAAATGDLLSTITLRQGSLQMLLAARQGRLFVANDDNLGQSGRVLTIDTRTGRVIHTESLGPYPSLALVDEGAARLLVGTSAARAQNGQGPASGGLAVLDAVSGRVTARIPLRGILHDAVLDDQRHRAILVYNNQNTLPAPQESYGLLDMRSGRLQPIALTNQNGQLPILDSLRGIAMIVENNESTVQVIDIATGAVRRAIRVDPFPASGVIDPTSGRGYAVAVVAATVDALDLTAGTVLSRTPVALITSPISDTTTGAEATGISLNLAGDRAFVALRNGQLAVVDTQAARLIRRLPTGLTFDWLPALVSHGLAYAMSNGEVAQDTEVDVRAGGKLTVFDPRSARVLRTISVGQGPSWPPLEDVTGTRLIIANSGASAGFNAFPDAPGAVSIVDAATGTLLKHITVGFVPSLIGIDQASRRLLVLNAAGDDVSAPAGPGLICSARTLLPETPSHCRSPYSSLSIIPLAP